ncbi:MAG: right-handed parallel beta-helix repeat-containing protein [Phycisphaerales bacterium]
MSALRSIITVLVLVALPVQAATTIYVSPAGNDAWSGRIAQPNVARTDGPVATLTRARDIIRETRSNQDQPRVLVADGRYPMTEPFMLAPEDSGVVYEAAPGARPVFSGGRVIRGFEQVENGLWRARVPDVAEGKWRFEQLFVNGRRAVRARTPNKFYVHMGETSETPIEGKPGQFLRTTNVPPETIAPLRGLSEAEIRDVVLVAYHKWCITQRSLKSVDFEKNQVITTGDELKSYSGWPAGTRFHLENFQAALDEPGEWFLGRDGVLYYKPRPGEEMAKVEVVAPVATKLVLVAGQPQAGKFVERVTLRNLAFLDQGYVLPEGGYEPYQAAYATEAAVMIDGARDVAIQNCEIGCVGEYAIWFRQGCQNCRIERSYLHDLGAGGVRIGEGEIRPDEASRTHHITVDNNIIRSGGRIQAEGVGVWVGHSSDNAVTHNEIADFFYTGLSVGWRWGYAESLAKRNNLSVNHVHHLGWAVLSDMGGVYTLGPSEGTVVSNNVFHDIYAYSYGGWGLYTDEGSTVIVMEKNLVYNTKTGSFHQHYGKENIIRNNIFVNSMLHQVQASRVEEHLSFTFERNLVYWQTGPLLAGPWNKVNVNMDNNCYWNAAGQEIRFVGLLLDQWRQQEGHDQHSIIADPGFVDAKSLNFHLKTGSPALKIGFVPFDYAKAGVYGDPAWIAKANDAKYPPLEWPPEAPQGAQ